MAEEDVLDTWFSSGLWPFSTLGWPEETADYQRYYPTSMMETGYDILFFWVARMIMMGLWFTERPPFHTVYLHGLVRDAEGRKFSKSLGNVIDPLILVDQFGADPLRFTLLTSSTPGNDVNLDTTRVEYNFKFINKIWNITKLVNMNLEGDVDLSLPAQAELDIPSRWIVSRANKLIDRVQHLFDIYQYGEAGNQILSFMWDEFAPWYLEVSKHPLYNGTAREKDNVRRVMVYVLDTCLRLLHPYMPFMTEEAWSYIPHKGETLMLASWPQADSSLIDENAETAMNAIMEMVRGIRNIRTEYNVDPGRRITAQVSPGSYQELLEQYHYAFSRLCNVEQTEILAAGASAPADAASTVVGDATIYLPLAGMIDIEAECKRLQSEQEQVLAQIQRAEGMLANDKFVNRAPAEVVERERKRLSELQSTAEQLAARLQELCQ